MKKYIEKLKSMHFRLPDRAEFLHKTHKGVHSVYFAAVFIEAHGVYAMAGGALFLLSLLDYFIHFE